MTLFDTNIEHEAPKRRPKVIVKKEYPISGKQRRYLFALIAERSKSEPKWCDHLEFGRLTSSINFKEMSQDFFGELTHLLLMDINAIRDGEDSNPFTGVKRFFVDIGSLYSHLKKFKCVGG